jgi:hypothetical protein
MIRANCTLEDCLTLVRRMAEELNIGWLQGVSEANVHRRERMARMWLERLKNVPQDRAAQGVQALLDRWEKERMPRPREVEQAVKAQGTTTNPATKAYHAWLDAGMDGECPVCGRLPSWAPRLMGDCSPVAHYHANVPLIGCHRWLHEAVESAKRLHMPWPHHDDAVVQFAPAEVRPLVQEGSHGASADDMSPEERAAAIERFGQLWRSVLEGKVLPPELEREAKRAEYLGDAHDYRNRQAHDI